MAHTVLCGDSRVGFDQVVGKTLSHIHQTGKPLDPHTPTYESPNTRVNAFAFLNMINSVIEIQCNTVCIIPMLQPKPTLKSRDTLPWPPRSASTPV